MKNAQATLLRIGALQLGRGVLEDATWREGRKGCSPVLCTEPVPLEPEYVPFDGAAIVSSFIAGPSPERSCVEGDTEVSGARCLPDSSCAPCYQDSPGADGNAAEEPTPMRTLRLFSAGEDISSPAWMDTLLQGLTVIGERFSFELAGAAGRVTFRFGIPESRIEVFKLTLQGLFPAMNSGQSLQMDRIERLHPK